MASSVRESVGLRVPLAEQDQPGGERDGRVPAEHREAGPRGEHQPAGADRRCRVLVRGVDGRPDLRPAAVGSHLLTWFCQPCGSRFPSSGSRNGQTGPSYRKISRAVGAAPGDLPSLRPWRPSPDADLAHDGQAGHDYDGRPGLTGSGGAATADRLPVGIGGPNLTVTTWIIAGNGRQGTRTPRIHQKHAF